MIFFVPGLLVFPSLALAQELPCGTPDGTSTFVNPLFNASCFSPLTPEDIYEDCTPVYVNVNLHVFVDSDCKGTVQYIGTSQANAYEWVENYINQCNYQMANNPVQWGSNQPAACMPFRWVLKGVYMHCKSNSSLIDCSGNLINSGTEHNGFFSDSPSGSGTSFGGFVIMEGLGNSIYNHEMGHEFGLAHSHMQVDFPAGHCDDTDPFLRNWDKDCDGTLDDYPFLNPLDEKEIICWTYIFDEPLGPPGSESDKNRNSVHDCSETSPCTVSPCCNWENINNNVMAYNKFQEAFTHCQSLLMLENTHAQPSLCKYIAAVGSACPPPSAFITQTAADKSNTNQYCNETLILRASYNESRYKCDIMLEGSQVVVYSTGWINGQAQNIPFTTDPNWNQILGQNLLLLSPATAYVATLHVENACNDQNTYTYKFVTPTINNCTEETNPGPGPAGAPLPMVVTPNPSTGSISVIFEGNDGEVFSAKAINLLSGNISTLISSYTATQGTNGVSLNVSGLNIGQYSLKMESTQKIYQGQFIKF